MPHDVIIIGGGPAGLSAALVLGRCRRSVALCDAGNPRNAAAAQLHCYLTRDGIAPRELLRLGREEIASYGVELIAGRAIDATCIQPAPSTLFEVTLENGWVFQSRKLLLATGIIDVLPPLENIEAFYGESVHHCPYCDGYEHRDQTLVAYGKGEKAAGLALNLLSWSSRVIACTDGGELTDAQRQILARNNIALREGCILRLEGTGNQLERIVFDRGEPLNCDALFFNTQQFQRSQLPIDLGCQYRENGKIRTTLMQGTLVPGVFLAGDADGDVQFAIVAAAEGATAAAAINRELQDEDRGAI